MSQQMVGDVITLPAASGSVPAFRIASVNSSGQCAIAVSTTSVQIGVTNNDASSTGEAVGIIINGTGKVACGASVAAGVVVGMQTDTGKVIDVLDTADTTTTAVPRAIGVSLQAGSTNSIIEITIQPVHRNRDASA